MLRKQYTVRDQDYKMVTLFLILDAAGGPCSSKCKITGICNSTTQKVFIEEPCCLDFNMYPGILWRSLLQNISTFDMEASYDRIFSIGMFEHMKNYKELLKKISHWMKPNSLLMHRQEFASSCSEEWLKNMDKNMNSVRQIMESTYGKDSAVKWTVYWRTFFIANSEFFYEVLTMMLSSSLSKINTSEIFHEVENKMDYGTCSLQVDNRG
ncbi:hypothetical protein POM88_036391 [Heracleum sosnowskyi]|uniref:Uncharacterized protein n=1 Tax=Heracleum sosnowskyi TaxID=360622 RepID=A0AAD8HN90_9APIA|nr:hypothetical protein POM88_036391 [Heracleum sosnowskyi]